MGVCCFTIGRIFDMQALHYEGNRTEKFWIYTLLDNGIAQMVSVAMVTKFSHEYVPNLNLMSLKIL